MQTLIDDARHALRLFRKTPLWTLGVAGTLALGIGAATAMFSIGNGVLLRSLPYSEPDRLVVLWGNNPPKGLYQERVTLADFADWRARSGIFEEIGYSFLWPGSRATIVRTSTSQEVRSALVSSAWLRAFGVQPALGRIFTSDEDHRGTALVAVISDGFWQRHFGRDPLVLGRMLTIDSYTEKNYQIVGVMPPGLQFPPATEIWLSLGAAQFEPPPPGAGQRCCEWLEVIARLRRGVALEQARTELNAIQSSIMAEHGPADVNPAVTVMPLARHLTGGARQAILLLVAAVACVLLIACVNAANLLLARSGSRKHEIAIRGALGATRFRIIRQLLTESVMIAALGGVAGLGLASVALDVFRKLAPNIPRLNEVQPDGAFVAICAATAMLTGIAFGLAPALQLTGSSFVHGQAAVGAGDRRARRLRDGLVVVEVAMSTVLLIGAALLLRSLERLDTVDPGFRAGGVLTARIDMSSATYSTSALPGPNRPQVFFRRLVDQVRRLPGVIAVGGANRLPLAGVIEGQGDIVTTQDAPNENSPNEDAPNGRSLRGNSRAVTPDYFRTMGMRLLSGRTFTEADTDESEPVVIVDEAAARRYWPGRDPLGRRLAVVNPRFRSTAPHWMRVVGLVADVRHAGLEAASPPQFYMPYFLGEWRSAYLVVHVQGEPAALVQTLTRQILAADPNAVATEVRPMETLVADSTAQARFRTTLLAAFSGLALLLAAAGIYGVVSCIVQQRTAEIGMRMALGARNSDIFLMVLGRGAVLTGSGLSAGIGAAIMLRRLIAGLLFETRPSDPVVLSGALAVLLLAGLGACWIPARRGSRMDPSVALRHDV